MSIGESVGDRTRTLCLPRLWHSASHTRGAGLSWEAPVLRPHILLSSGSRTLYEAKAPNCPAENPAFPPPLSRTQANSEAAPATSGALP